LSDMVSRLDHITVVRDRREFIATTR
jgi:hypothetical protein